MTSCFRARSGGLPTGNHVLANIRRGRMTSGSAIRRVVPSALAAAFFLTCSATSGAEKIVPRSIDSHDMAAAQSAADAPNARLVALVDRAGNILQSKGVDSVKRIDTGVYCIRPQASANINPKNSIAIVTAEWSYSRFNEVEAQWARAGSGCGSDRFGVITTSDFNLNAKYVRSNDAAFTIYVP